MCVSLCLCVCVCGAISVSAYEEYVGSLYVCVGCCCCDACSDGGGFEADEECGELCLTCVCVFDAAAMQGSHQ